MILYPDFINLKKHFRFGPSGMRFARALVLHGKYQDADKMRAFVRSASPKVADLLAEALFVPAPFLEMPKAVTAAKKNARKTVENRREATPATSLNPEQFRVWWRDGCEREDFGKCKGLLQPYLEQIDVIVGFSQGAALASLLVTKPVSEELGFYPKLALLCAGYPLHFEWSQALLDQGTCKTRTVVLAGSADRVVHVDRSKELASFLGADMLLHAGGHRFPRDDMIDERIQHEALNLKFLLFL